MKKYLPHLVMLLSLNACSISYYAINAKHSSRYLFITKSYPYTDRVELTLNYLHRTGSLIGFKRTDSLNSSFFTLDFISKDSIRLKDLFKFESESYDKEIKKNMEFILVDIDSQNDTVFRRMSGKILVDKFRHRTSKGPLRPDYKFYPN